MADTTYTGLTVTNVTAASRWAFAQSGTSFANVLSSFVIAQNSTNPGITFTSIAQGATVTLGAANTFSTACSLSLAAGTWLLNSHMLIGKNVSTGTLSAMYSRIHDGTNEYAIGEQKAPLVTSSYSNIALTAIITLGNTSTVNLDGACSVQTSFIRGRNFANAAGSTATRMTAVKIG